MYNPILLFSVFERNTINRMQFLIGHLYIFALMFIVIMASPNQEPSLFALLLSLVLSMVLSFKRLKNAGLHGAWVLLKLIPIVDVMLFIFLLVFRSKQQETIEFKTSRKGK